MSWTAVAGSAVQAGSSLGGQAMANAYNKKEAKRQRDWNEEMWHMENAYNTPAATMQRYRDAGLNPNLIVGEGAVGGGQAGAVSGYDRAAMENPMQNFDPVGDYLRLKEASLSIEERGKSIEGIDLKNAYQSILNDNLRQRTGIESERQEQERTLYQQQQEQEKIRTQTMILERMLKEKQLDKDTIELAFMEAEKVMGLAKTQADIKYIDGKINLDKQEWSFIDKHQMKIPQNLRTGLAVKYILNSLDGKMKGKASGVLKSINELTQDAVDRYWKSYNPKDQRNKDWRTRKKTNMMSTTPGHFYVLPNK